MHKRLWRFIVALLIAVAPLNGSSATAYPADLARSWIDPIVAASRRLIPDTDRSLTNHGLPLAPVASRANPSPLMQAGTVQTITVEVASNSLIANSGATAVVTATVVDMTGTALSGVIVTGTIAPSTLGAVSGFGSTNGSGQVTGTWTAGPNTLVGTGAISVTDGLVSGTTNVTLTADILDTIVVTPSVATVTAGLTQTFTAGGFDVFSNTVLITPTWTSSAGTIDASGVFTVPHTVTSSLIVTATSDAISKTATVDITAAPLDTIVITPSSTTVTAGLTQTFTAGGFDVFSNTVLITPTWTTNGGSIDPNTGLFTAQITATTGSLVTATYSAIPGIANVTIAAAPLDTIIISPSSATITVGLTRPFSASGYDQYNNSVAITPNWASNGGDIDASGVFTAQTTVMAGRVVTAASGAISQTAAVNLIPAAPFTLALSPATAVITAGTRITYTAVATDVYGNGIGVVTSGTIFSITPASGGTFVGNAVTPTIKNTYTITGKNGLAVGFATLTITPTTFSRLAIETAPAGSGASITNTTLTVYDTLTAYAVGYDVYSNTIGSRSATWGGTGVIVGWLTPTTGISTTFSPVVSGTGVLTATSGGRLASTGTITVQAPFMQISKSYSPDLITPGNQLQYTIVYTNAGNATAQNVVVTETYPVSTTFLFATSTPNSGTNNIWSLGALAAGGHGIITVGLTVTNQLPIGTVLTNTVRISAAKVNTAITTTMTPVNAMPDVSVSAIGSPEQVRPGDLLTYTIQYRNDGTAPVTNVRITDTYPSQVAFVSATPSPASGDNVWTIGALNGLGQSGLITVTVRVAKPLDDLTVLNNSVTIDTSETEPFTSLLSTQVIAPVFRLTTSASTASPAANSLLTYTVRYTNTGSSYASNTFVTDTIPANTVYQSCAPLGCSLNGNTVQWNLGQLDPLTTGVLTLTVHVNNNLPSGTVLVNTAGISSTDLVSALANVANAVTSAPGLRLATANGVSTVAAGDTLTYTLHYTNTGNAPAQNVVITDAIPSNTAFLDCSTCLPLGGGVYAFALNTVNANQSGLLTLRVKLNSTLPAGLRAITNTVRLATTTAGEDMVDNVAYDVDLISTAPALALAAAFDTLTPYPGKIVTYTVHFTNTSAMDTTGVAIDVTRSPFIGSAPNGWNTSGNQDSYLIGNVAAGQSGLLTYAVSLPLTFTEAMNAFTNTFMIHDDGPGGLPIASRYFTTTLGVPDVVIESIQAPGSVVGGQKFTVTLTIRNRGLGRACNPKAIPCGTFGVEVFIDPAVPPVSYPFTGYGNDYRFAAPIAPGATVTVSFSGLSFAVSQKPILYFKADNWDCSLDDPCLPSQSLGGQVPESNEYNNVIGPVNLKTQNIYLPIVRRNR